MFSMSKAVQGTFIEAQARLRRYFLASASLEIVHSYFRLHGNKLYHEMSRFFKLLFRLNFHYGTLMLYLVLKWDETGH